MADFIGDNRCGKGASFLLRLSLSNLERRVGGGIREERLPDLSSKTGVVEIIDFQSWTLLGWKFSGFRWPSPTRKYRQEAKPVRGAGSIHFPASVLQIV
jgi:hypothetical protein